MSKKKLIFVAVLALSGLLLAQVQPLKPAVNIPFTPQLLTTIKEQDVIGQYGSVWKIYWDGWEGTLVLFRGGKGYIEDSDRNRYDLTYVILKNPQDNIMGMTGPGYTGKNSNLGHRIVFLVDFARTPNDTKDDQRFDGYVLEVST
ncbi:hypothetical protein [Pseudothermotoga thermarum]|uniref:Uncharacterized protein n=1 Tax=Pseudothermotoga thermarum DSM 5069 TaxID=688269 RepID=F7YWX4_9THEM|nr:hypothetical protein [Pseudothermotoga thermarum]AEH50566.1 hypothetical protein Theth_0474 [Pseudothermotoga thermarum DSM 5069]